MCDICNRKVMFIDLIDAKKIICRFKSNMYMFFYEISRIFSRFLIILWYDFNVFKSIISSAGKFTHTFYIFNQNIYRTKWFTILESQFIGNPELFWTKKISGFYIKFYGGWYSLLWYHDWAVENMKIPRNLMLTGWHL